MDTSELKIDIVYTWVNGVDPEYMKLCQQYSKETMDMNPERFRDIYQLLKYSMRSLELYMPWVNNIFILTQRPQVPDWLDTSHPKIKLVHHDEVFENKEHLPTFSCNTIESYLDKIPGLSDYFIYMNDDFLFGRETSKDMFVSPEGRINVFGTIMGENLPFRLYDGKNDIIGLGLVEHCPLLIHKKYWADMAWINAKKMEQTRSNKFRKRTDYMMPKLYKYYMLRYQRKHSRAVKLWELNKFHMFYKITNDLKYQQERMAKLRTMRPNFYCLNDDQRDNPNLEVVDMVKGFLQDSYPKPSSFEKKIENYSRI